MTKRTTRTRAEAKKLMWEYYRDNKETLPAWVRDRREKVLIYLLNGLDVKSAYAQVIKTCAGTRIVR